MATAQTPGLTVETFPEGEDRDRTRRLSEHFAQVSARYRTLRELDLDAVRLISEVVARGAEPGRPVRLLDVATGSGRYLDAVSQCLAAVLAVEVVPIGLDLSPAMLTQARIRNGHTGLRARHLVGSVETLPFRTSSCDVMTCFNAVHHVDLARFAGEASRVLTPAGQLVVYTRTPEQNRRTIWGHHFPEFATRLVDQATHYHYSTFRLYPDDALRAAIDTFRQRVRQAFRDLTRITYDNDHVLVMAQRDGM